jgi:putative CocE/NonD family hydrolase
MTARPLGPRAAAVGALMSRAWSLPPRRNRVAVERGLAVPMSDGTVLLADHYLPVSVASAATVLVRCPYGRSGPFALQNAQLLAERGYHVLLQSVRGTFGSGGEFEPMRHEITDGQDTVAWLRRQRWFEGRLATFGASYLGFVQWALAMDRRRNWSRPSCTWARTTSAAARSATASSTCTTTSPGATWRLP